MKLHVYLEAWMVTYEAIVNEEKYCSWSQVADRQSLASTATVAWC